MLCPLLLCLVRRPCPDAAAEIEIFLARAEYLAKVVFDTALPQNILENIAMKGNGIEVFSFYALKRFPPLLRLLLSIVFVGSFIVRPQVMRPLSLVWARIVESEKPVFTVVFGGAAAFATAISDAARHL
jgi:hypothetical protein